MCPLFDLCIYPVLSSESRETLEELHGMQLEKKVLKDKMLRNLKSITNLNIIF